MHQWRRAKGAFIGFGIAILIAACMLGSALTLLFTVPARHAHSTLRRPRQRISNMKAATALPFRNMLNNSASSLPVAQSACAWMVKT